MHRLSQSTWIRCRLILKKIVIFYLSRCSAFITMTLLMLLLLVS